MKVIIPIEVEAPEGATHYSGDPWDEPTWWKYATNSTGTVSGWFYKNDSKRDGPWYYLGDGFVNPYCTKEIPK